MSPFFLSMLGRLLLAALLGAVVGLQRERKQRPAGMRTHTLVSVGAALITLVSASYTQDPARITAQVVSGIGFLGAGTIIREGHSVRGLTTAASLWAVAGLGIACGRGGQVLWLAMAVTLIIVVTLELGKRLEDWLFLGEESNVLAVQLDASVLPRLLQALADAGAALESASEHRDRRSHHYALRLRLPATITRNDAVRIAMAVDGVAAAAWGGPVDRDWHEA